MPQILFLKIYRILLGEQACPESAHAAVEVVGEQRFNFIKFFMLDNIEHFFMVGEDVRYIFCADDIKADKAGVVRMGRGKPLPEIGLIRGLEPDLMHGEVGRQKPLLVKISKPVCDVCGT